MPLDAFTPQVRDWFERAFATPTPAQAQAWPAIASGEHVLVQAPTGSGKSTQIPQMLWRHGLLGEKGEVVVLQPRRLAARLLAKRVAEEAGTNLGEGVGYQIRLESRVSERTRIRFVTEGILLRQMSFDATLRGSSKLLHAGDNHTQRFPNNVRHGRPPRALALEGLQGDSTFSSEFGTLANHFL